MSEPKKEVDKHLDDLEDALGDWFEAAKQSVVDGKPDMAKAAEIKERSRAAIRALMGDFGLDEEGNKKT